VREGRVLAEGIGERSGAQARYIDTVVSVTAAQNVLLVGVGFVRRQVERDQSIARQVAYEKIDGVMLW
jgi:hypothetical protein